MAKATVPSYVTSDGITVKLTATSSMPCNSWSLPAEKACPASKLSVRKLGKNAVCQSCYAMKGFYRMPNVKDVQGKRFAWVLSSLVKDGGTEFVEALVRMVSDDVRQRGEPIFRVHDSGDLFNHAYVSAWGRIADALPNVRFWIPTRSHSLPLLLESIRALAARPNVVVRPSALAFDELPPVVDGLAAGTTVIRSLPVLDSLPGVRLCPKTDPTDGRKACGSCRTCFEGTTPVAYLEH